LALVGRVDEVYRLGGPRVRRLANQCFFDKLLISVEDEEPTVAGATLREPWATLLAEEFIQQMAQHTTNPGSDLDGRGSNMRSLVHPTRQHTNPQVVIEGPELAVAAAHAKVRRDGYHGVQRR
jgi:hypothetical protein